MFLFPIVKERTTAVDPEHNRQRFRLGLDRNVYVHVETVFIALSLWNGPSGEERLAGATARCIII